MRLQAKIARVCADERKRRSDWPQGSIKKTSVKRQANKRDANMQKVKRNFFEKQASRLLVSGSLMCTSPRPRSRLLRILIGPEPTRSAAYASPIPSAPGALSVCPLTALSSIVSGCVLDLSYETSTMHDSTQLTGPQNLNTTFFHSATSLCCISRGNNRRSRENVCS